MKGIRIPSLTTGMIRFLMLPIMIICIGASVRFSAFWHIYIGIIKEWSWGLSGAFILMANIMFAVGTGRRLVWNSIKKFIYTKGERLALLLWFVITVYSMATSVAAQFNRHLEKQQSQGITATSTDQVRLAEILEELEKEKNPVAVYSEDLLDSYNESIRLLQEEMSGVNSDLRSLEPMPNVSDYETQKEYEDARWYWYDTKKRYDSRLTEIRAALSDYQEKKSALLLPPPVDDDRVEQLEEQRDVFLDKGAVIKNDEKSRDDIFSWLSSVLGPSPDMIQFLLSLFPALFIDILAPVASVIFFYGLGGLNDNKKKEEDTGFTENDMQEAYKEGAGKAFGLVRREVKSSD